MPGCITPFYTIHSHPISPASYKHPKRLTNLEPVMSIILKPGINHLCLGSASAIHITKPIPSESFYPRRQVLEQSKIHFSF